jgi:hypothetical protein
MKRAANRVDLKARITTKTHEISADGQRRNSRIWVWKCPVKFNRKFRLPEKVNYQNR